MTWIADYVDAYNTYDAELALQFMTENAVYEDAMAGVRLTGKADILRFYVKSYRQSSNSQAVIISEQHSGQQFAFEWEISGTNDLASGSLPATHKPFKIRGVSVGEADNGQFTLKRDYYNAADLLA